MCGIAGILSYNGQPVNLQELKTMTDTIAHRGPDGEGQWISADGKTGFGHRRLSIIDLSDAASQPMRSSSGRFTITFNGEVYNFPELRDHLEKKGIRFRTASDTEVLIELYAYYGESCLRFIDGMFAFAIHDDLHKTVFIARDRFGEKPFYWCRHEGKLYFASEMKSLFAAGFPKKVSEKRLHYYLAYNLYIDPADLSSTFFEHVFQLPAGHFMRVNAEGEVKSSCYWQVDEKTELNIALPEAKERFDQLLRESVRRRLRSDVPVGSSLSGGLDSSTIVLLIEQMKNFGQEQKTFSARFRNFDKDESEYIDELLRVAASVKGYSTYPDASVLDELDRIWYHQEEPFGSASIVAQWSVMKLARENNVTVLLDGQGADEILGGYRTFFQPLLNSLYAKHSPDYPTEKKALADNQHFIYEPVAATRYMLRYPKLFSLASSAGKILRPARKKNEMPRGNYSGAFYEIARQYPNPFIGENNDDIRKLQKRTIERAGFVPLLRYADRNSMAHARELRLPFLSHELVEFCIALPDQLKVSQGWTKYLLRQAYSSMLPGKICWRKDKIGFVAPQENWLSGNSAREKVEDAKRILEKEKITASGKSFSDWHSLMAAKLIGS